MTFLPRRERDTPPPEGALSAVVGDWFARIYRFYAQDPFISRFRRFMMISRYENEASDERFRDMFINKSLRYYEAVFEERIQACRVSGADPTLMAVELYAPLFLFMTADGGNAAANEKRCGTTCASFSRAIPF